MFISVLPRKKCYVQDIVFLVFLKDIGLFILIFPSGLQQAYGHRTWYITTFYMVCTFWAPFWKCHIKYGLSVLPSILLPILLSILSVWALGLYHKFFWNCSMVLETCVKLCMAELDFLEYFFCPKNLEDGPRMGQKQGFLNLFKNLLINFYWICSIVKFYIWVPAQIPHLGKFLFLRYGPKCSQPVKLQEFLINQE